MTAFHQVRTFASSLIVMSAFAQNSLFAAS
jgi:hypothetical protein